MKFDYEELMGYYNAVRYGRPGDGEYEDAIEAIIDAAPKLIAWAQELEKQRVELAELAIYGNGCFDCPLEDVCLYKEELIRDSAVCSKLLIEWVEKAAKEARND